MRFSRQGYWSGLPFLSPFLSIRLILWGFSGDVVVKILPANAEDPRVVGSIPGPGRSPGGENGNPLQYSCLENSWTEEPGMLYGVAKSQTQLNDWAQSYPMRAQWTKAHIWMQGKRSRLSPPFFWSATQTLYNTISCQPVVFCFPLSMNAYCLQDAWFPAPVPISLLIASYLPAITVLCLK